MPLTPQQLAELQRLKELMRPQAEEFTRRMQAVANAEKGSGQGVSLPTDKKAKGGLESFLKDSAVKKRLYHGTDKDFNVFNTPAYFSPDPEYASTGNISAGQNRSVMPVHLNLKNPARIDSTVKLTKQKINSLIKKGHDGAIGYINEYPFEYIAFHPHQIKSAIGNRGTYDPTNPDITKAKGGSVMGINVASDRKAGLQYADLIVDGHKTLESRNTDSLRPYVGKRVAIVRTGHGPAKAIGEVTIGEPIVVNKKKFRSLERQHMVPEGSAFDISTPTKHLYPLSDPQRYEQEHDVGHGIVARKVMHKADGGTIPSQDVMRLAIGGQGPKNWLRGSVEQAIDPLKSKVTTENFVNYTPEQVQQLVGSERIKRNDAINQWIERNLGNYIKKQMATHDDPIRKLAEQGIVHMPPEQMGYGSSQAEGVRQKMGAPRLGQSEAAQAWEDAADVSMYPNTVAEINQGRKLGGPTAHLHEPWMEKADPNTKVWQPRVNMHAHYLGFDHLVDILKQDLAEGRIRPEQLSKVSIEHAVRRAHEYDQERKKAMAETALKATEGMPVHKDYGDGYKWIELALPKELPEGYSMSPAGTYVDPEGKQSIHHPGYGKLADAMKYEGDTMGHCVKGESYVSGVAKGEKRIFSLRDAKNEPHVTIEVNPQPHPIGTSAKGHGFPYRMSYGEYSDPPVNIPKETEQQIFDLAKQFHQQRGGADHHKHFQDAANQILGPLPAVIRQIKGKQNAKPKKDYIPYVQDFVKSGNWSDVGDLHNTDLHEVKEGEIPGFAQWMHIKAHGSVPKIPSGYYTPQELIRFGKESGLAQLHPSVHKKWIENLGLPPEDNKAHGGRVTHAHHLEIEERPL